jgi:hypothetical protein
VGPGPSNRHLTSRLDVVGVGFRSFALFFGLAREGQPEKQSKNPNLDPTSHRFTTGTIGIGGVPGVPLGGPGPQQQEHKQNVWVFVLFFGLAREGQPKKQSKNPNLDPTNHRFTIRIISIGAALGSLRFGGPGS